MKYALIFILFSPSVYANEPVKFVDFMNGCYLNVKNQNSCETYLLGFLNSFVLSKEASELCNTPKSAKSAKLLLSELKFYLENNSTSKNKHYDIEIHNYLNSLCGAKTP
jgi:hypothetical protein